MRLSRRLQAFDSDEFIYELKIDGFRALAHIADGQGELISRNGNVFRGFAELASLTDLHTILMAVRVAPVWRISPRRWERSTPRSEAR